MGHLVTAGPYAYVRHPLYLGSLLVGVGTCIIVGRLWFAVLTLGLLVLVYRRKILHEELLLADELGTPYVVYRAAVPRYVPTWRRYPNPQGQWSWQGIVASKEWKTSVWTVVLLIGLYFREEVIQDHEWLFEKHWPMRLCLLGLLVILVAWDGLFEVVRRRRRVAPVTGRGS